MRNVLSQINVVKTIEQILGIPPMNQEDGATVPMYDAFTDKPDFRPYDVLPNQVPLTLGVAQSPAAAAVRTRARVASARSTGSGRRGARRSTSLAPRLRLTGRIRRS